MNFTDAGPVSDREDAPSTSAPSAFCPKHAMADQLHIPGDELHRIMGHIRLEIWITQNVEKKSLAHGSWHRNEASRRGSFKPRFSLFTESRGKAVANG